MFVWIKSWLKRIPAAAGSVSDATSECDRLVSFMISQIPADQLTAHITGRDAYRKKLEGVNRSLETISFFLYLENYLNDVVFERPESKRADFRSSIANEFPALLPEKLFGIVFQSAENQTLRLQMVFLEWVFDRAFDLLGATSGNVIEKLRAEVSIADPVSSDTPSRLYDVLQPGRAQAETYAAVAHEFFDLMKKKLGERATVAMFDKVYASLSVGFQWLEAFSELVNLFPLQYLDEQKLAVFDRGQMKALLIGKIEELRHANDELASKNVELEAKEELLKASNQNLEQLVRDRTASLEKSNANLRLENEERKKTEALLKHAKARAEEMVKLKNSFLLNMSHEIRTPLTGILGYSSILSGRIDEPELKSIAERLTSSGNRLLDTLNSVLSLAKSEATGSGIQMTTVDVAHVILGTVELFQPSAELKGITIEANLQPGVLNAKGDEQFLRQVMNNLVGNAVKFTENGRIKVAASVDGEHVVIQVEDTGIGISEEFMARIFDEFSQESSGMNRRFEGTGLGLAIARKLVQLMGGSIELDQDIEQGSRFTVRLRWAEEDLIADSTDEVEPDSATDVSLPLVGNGVKESKPRLLLVEDNEDSQEIIQTFLRKRFQITTATHAEQAISIAAGEHFDLVLMDINLTSDMDGVSVMQELRTYDSFNHTPFVAISAYCSPEEKKYFLAQGFVDFIEKPFTRRSLNDKLALVLQESEL